MHRMDFSSQKVSGYSFKTSSVSLHLLKKKISEQSEIYFGKIWGKDLTVYQLRIANSSVIINWLARLSLAPSIILFFNASIRYKYGYCHIICFETISSVPFILLLILEPVPRLIKLSNLCKMRWWTGCHSQPLSLIPLYLKFQTHLTVSKFVSCWFLFQAAFFLIHFFIYLTVLGLSFSTWDLIPWSRIEPGPPILRSWNLSHWTINEIPKQPLE